MATSQPKHHPDTASSLANAALAEPIYSAVGEDA
jgi:hypothetical protein